MSADEAAAYITELRAIVAELHRLGLVIESSVRHSEGVMTRNHVEVMALIRRARELQRDVTPPDQLGADNPLRWVVESLIDDSESSVEDGGASAILEVAGLEIDDTEPQFWVRLHSHSDKGVHRELSRITACSGHKIRVTIEVLP